MSGSDEWTTFLDWTGFRLKHCVFMILFLALKYHQQIQELAGLVLTVSYSLWTNYQFAQECFWLGQITQLYSSEDPVCQPSISLYELYFLFQFHLHRKQEVLTSFIPIHSSVHTGANQFSHLELLHVSVPQ